jgi:deoxyadenosine/deoxycytidine kinase
MSGYDQCPDASFGKNCMRNLYYVAIEGTIGVGKTSLAKLLADRLSAKLVLETFEDNPFLADFYDDPEAMHSKRNYGFYFNDINNNRIYDKLICFII